MSRGPTGRRPRGQCTHHTPTARPAAPAAPAARPAAPRVPERNAGKARERRIGGFVG